MSNYNTQLQTNNADLTDIRDNIRNLSGGSTDTTCTAEAKHILNGKTAIVNGEKLTGTMPVVNETTYTPTTSNQIISAGQYLQGDQTIKGDANLVAENIKSGVSIFGITGTHSGGFQVKSITTSGNYNSSAYRGSYWAAIDNNGNLLLVVTGGTNTSYESIYFPDFSAPSGVTQVGESFSTYTSMTASMLYCTVFSGITSNVSINLEFSARNGTYDRVTCITTITYV